MNGVDAFNGEKIALEILEMGNNGEAVFWYNRLITTWKY
jgi:hypothetical protein